MSGRVRTPALALWRAELERGERTRTTLDPLRRAACADMNALEAEADGMPEIAASHRREAREILRHAVRETVA